jgi:hypothetical protein
LEAEELEEVDENEEEVEEDEDAHKWSDWNVILEQERDNEMYSEEGWWVEKNIPSCGLGWG